MLPTVLGQPVVKSLHLSVGVLTFILAQFACAESNPASFAYILQADSFAKTKNPGHLKILALAKKPVLIIKHPKTPERKALAKKLANGNGLVWLVTDRQLKTLGESGK